MRWEDFKKGDVLLYDPFNVDLITKIEPLYQENHGALKLTMLSLITGRQLLCVRPGWSFVTTAYTVLRGSNVEQQSDD